MASFLPRIGSAWPHVEARSLGSGLEFRVRVRAQTKTPRGDPRGVFEKSGDTYFRAGGHYHRPEKLNDCVRNGDRCDLFSMFTRRRAWSGKARTHLIWSSQEWDKHQPCGWRSHPSICPKSVG